MAKYPDYQEKLRAEINSTFKSTKDIEHSKFNNLTFLSAFIDEALRLYGPANALIPRTAIKDHYIKDLFIP